MQSDISGSRWMSAFVLWSGLPDESSRRYREMQVSVRLVLSCEVRVVSAYAGGTCL